MPPLCLSLEHELASPPDCQSTASALPGVSLVAADPDIRANFPFFCALCCRYDSFTDSSRNEMKRKFALTMEFVEEYLKEVVNQPFPFGDKEKNKLTFEVLLSSLHPTCSILSDLPNPRAGFCSLL